MGKQTIGLGSAANDKSGDGARVAGAKINDNFTELYDAITLVQSAISAIPIKVATTCNGGNAQVIAYPTQRANTPPAIIDYEGNGIELVSSDADGFTINSLTAGNFIYIH